MRGQAPKPAYHSKLRGNGSLFDSHKRSKLSTVTESSDESDLASEDDDNTWISWYCGLRGNEWFCKVDEEYIQDDFNLTGLRSLVPNYEYALDLILDEELSDEKLTEEQHEIIETAAEMLYGLIHARFILASRGLELMKKKYLSVDFGRCPRVQCQGQPVLPVGQTDVPRKNSVKIYCPKCKELYFPKLSRHQELDGAYFGTTFAHLLLQTYSEFIPKGPVVKYVPRIYGFKIHQPEQTNASKTKPLPAHASSKAAHK